MKISFVLAWLLCAFLDGAYATALTAYRGASISALWQRVASGPFGDGVYSWGAYGTMLGLVVHMTIMAVMVYAFWILRRLAPRSRILPNFAVGTAFGLGLYLVMYYVVMPLRWPSDWVTPTVSGIVIGLFPHIAFVGIPLAYLIEYVERSTPADLN